MENMVRELYGAISGTVFPCLVVAAAVLFLKWHIIPGIRLMRMGRRETRVQLAGRRLERQKTGVDEYLTIKARDL